MSIGKQAAKAGLWLAGFRVASQALSWVVTIAVARILTPADYGLMAMASIFTGYVEVFSEMGMGAAIVQRDSVSPQELSSNFWFSLMVGCGFAGSAWVLAYPTAWIFADEAVISLTQMISVLFIVGGLMVVPYNLLTRQLRFQEIGMVQLVAAAFSSLAMLWMAQHDYGVWTLIGGVIVLRVSTVAMVFYASGWRPFWHYRFDEVRPFLRFGLGVAGARSLFYCFQKMDRFIVGKVLGAQALGLYSFAMEMASLPTDKMMSVVNQVSLPLFSRIRHDQDQLVTTYLKVTRYVTLAAAPVFMGGAIFGRDIVLVILGEQWEPCVFLFRAFCVVQVLVAFSSLHGIVHTALGHPARMIRLYAILLGVMGPALWLASSYGVNALAFPWVVLYPLVWVGWTIATLNVVKVSWWQYWQNACAPAGVALFIMVAVASGQYIWGQVASISENLVIALAGEILLAGVLYITYVYVQERELVAELKSLRRS